MKPGCKRCAQKGTSCWQHPKDIARRTGKQSDGTYAFDGEVYGPWDEVPDRCNARKLGGDGRCRMVAGYRTDHLGVGACFRHGGRTPSANKSAQKKLAQRAMRELARPVEIEPAQALLEELSRTHGWILWLQDWIGQYDPDSLVFGPTKENTVEVRRDGANGGDATWELQGVRHIEARAVRSVWLEMFQSERRHLVTVAKECVNAGIMERQTRLAEEHARSIARGFRAFVAQLGDAGLIEPSDRRIPKLVRAALVQVSSHKDDEDDEGT